MISLYESDPLPNWPIRRFPNLRFRPKRKFDAILSPYFVLRTPWGCYKAFSRPSFIFISLPSEWEVGALKKKQPLPYFMFLAFFFFVHFVNVFFL